MKYRLSRPTFSEEMLKKVTEVISTGMLVQGAENANFEEGIASYFGVETDHVALVSSGTAALHSGMLALGLGIGDKVIVPNFTFPATANAVEMTGATCVMVDVSPRDYNIDIACLKRTLDYYQADKTLKAIVVVHEFGAPAHMSQILELAKEHNLFVIEDAACAFGTRCGDDYAGLIGDVGCFSLHPRKALTTGEGGVVVSKKIELIEQVKQIRNHGMAFEDGKVDFVQPGLNYRMTNFQAALGNMQLSGFNEWLEVRKRLQAIYRGLLNHEIIQLPLFDEGHSWQSFMIVFTKKGIRDAVKEALKLRGIESNYGAYPVSEMTFYKNKYGKENQVGLNGTAIDLFENGLCLPLHQGMTEDDVRIICKELLDVVVMHK